MSFQINEKLMAHDRAIITRNNKESDLTLSDSLKFKPGMLHFITENDKMFLSIVPKKEPDGSTKKFLELMTDKNVSELLLNYVGRAGGANNSLKGQLHSIVARGTAPFKIASDTEVTNLNADMVDGYHADIFATGRTIVVRDSEGTVLLGKKVRHGGNVIVSTDFEGFEFVTQGGDFLTLSAKDIELSNGVISTPTSKIEWKNNAWNAGPTGSTSKIITKSNFAEETINIVVNSTAPVVTNENTFWFEEI